MAAETEHEEILKLFEIWCRMLRITPTWDVALEFVEDPAWRKTENLKVLGKSSSMSFSA